MKPPVPGLELRLIPFALRRAGQRALLRHLRGLLWGRRLR